MYVNVVRVFFQVLTRLRGVDPFVRGNEPLLKSQARVFARYSNNKGQNLLICFPLPSHPSHCEKTSNIYKAVLWGSGVGSRCCKTKLGIQIFSYNSHQFPFIILFSPTDCRELCSVQSFTCSQRQRQIYFLAPAEWIVLAFKEIRSGGGIKGHFPCV